MSAPGTSAGAAPGDGRAGTPLAAAPLERALAERLGQLLAVDDPVQLAAVALAAGAPRSGHVCVELDRVDADQPPPSGSTALAVVPPAAADWAAALLAGPLARRPGEQEVTPLVVDGNRCYLDRYWGHEDALRSALEQRSAEATPRVPPGEVAAVLDQVLPRRGEDPAPDRQRLAVANALLRPLAVVTGGPGTGKTHTIVSLLAARLLLAARRGEPPPRIALAAPTGKAAARMGEAVRTAIAERTLPPEVLDALRDLQPTTLHRLLGHRPWAPTRPVRSATDPLAAELVVVDEASMVALAMMRRLVDAVMPAATLVLVGDRDQLTSVEAGAVLGDVCGPRTAGPGGPLRLSPGWAAVLDRATGEDVAAVTEPPSSEPGIWDAVVELARPHRFDAASGIGAVAAAVQAAGEDGPAAVVELLDRRRAAPGSPALFHEDVQLAQPTGGRLPADVQAAVVAAAAPMLAAARDGDAAGALAALEELGLLCATREGPLGVRGVGDQVERLLRGALPDAGVSPGGQYVGRPVLVTRNDRDLGLANGDVGVVVERDGVPVVAFPAADGGVRTVAAVRLPPHETVWAMTIHKAQGSQYRHAVVVLPDRDTRVLSRELVYTGVTRARERLTVVADVAVLESAVARPVRRATGLAERLWPTSG